jgi:hypothetical protein
MEANTSKAYSNISSYDVTILFEEMFNDRPLKTVGICCSYASVPVLLCLCYGIIWFERFGSGNCIYSVSAYVFDSLSLISEMQSQ